MFNRELDFINSSPTKVINLNHSLRLENQLDHVSTVTSWLKFLQNVLLSDKALMMMINDDDAVIDSMYNVHFPLKHLSILLFETKNMPEIYQ